MAVISFAGMSVFADPIPEQPEQPIDIVESAVYSKVVSFNLTQGHSKTTSVTCAGTPAFVSYWSCNVGKANITIKVNNVTQGTYTIPETGSTTINIPISCSVGDTITCTVYVASGYYSAQGSYTINY